MQNKIKIILCTVLIFCFASVNAIEIIPAQPDTTQPEEILDSLPERFVSYSQVSIGFSQRADEGDIISHAPMFHTKLYYQLSENLATKFGIGFSTSNKFKSSNWETIYYKTLKLETGFRWNISNVLITLYHENGFEYNYYYEPKSKIWEHRIGMNFSLGINFHVTKKLQIDIAIGQTLNNADFTKTINSNPPLTPIGLIEDKFFKEVFNPFAIQLLLFRRL